MLCCQTGKGKISGVSPCRHTKKLCTTWPLSRNPFALLVWGSGLDVNPPKCRNLEALEVMKSRNANIRHTWNPKCHSLELTILRMAIIRMTFHPNFFDLTSQTPDVSFVRKGQFHEILYQRMVVRSMSVIYQDWICSRRRCRRAKRNDRWAPDCRKSHKSNLFQSYLSCRINSTGSHKKQYMVASGAKNIQIGRLYEFIRFYGVFYRIATYNKVFGIIPTCS